LNGGGFNALEHQKGVHRDFHTREVQFPASQGNTERRILCNFKMTTLTPITT
jgi:hypothetical protein